MNMTFRSKVVKIGNSRGIRIPRTLLEQVDLENEIEIIVDGNKLIIQSAHHPRHGWETKFSEMARLADDHLLDDAPQTHWDRDEWTW